MARRYKKPKSDMGLNITSMMDMFTIILVFMLKNFSTDGNVLTNADDLVLPYSESKQSPKEVSVSINCTYDWIIIDNKPVVPTKNVAKLNNVVIKRIKDKLDICMRQEEDMVRIGALNKVRGEIVVQIDKNIDFDIVYKVMATCGRAGYNNIKLAVMSRES